VNWLIKHDKYLQHEESFIHCPFVFRCYTDYKSKCAFGSFQSQRRFDLVTAFTPVYTGYILKRTFGAF
jgi:hypothetical protein